MAMCELCDPPRRFSKKGILIHQAKVHGVHPQHDDIKSIETMEKSPYLCPVPGCGVAVSDLLPHLIESHESWRLSSGKFVFEVV